MIPRQLTARIVQRTSKALVVTALALGLSASVLAPSSAFAAPLNPRPGPTYSPDLAMTGYFVGKAPDGQVLVAFVMKNQGSSPASTARLKVALPDEVSDVAIYKTNGPVQCAVTDGAVWCTADNALEAGGEVGVSFFATLNDVDSATFVGTADPNGLVREGKETNNQASVVAQAG